MHIPKHHNHRVHPRMRGTQDPARRHKHTQFPPGTLSPEQVLIAYGYKKGMYAGAAPVKLGIGSLGGGVVQADLDNAASAWGVDAHITVRTVGGATNDPSDQDSNVENSLDLLVMSFTWWWLTGTPADVIICFGPNAANGMTLVTQDLVAAGCKVASWSWGSAASGWDPAERATLAAAFADGIAKGCTFFAASGDNSLDDGTNARSADYPCSDENVWAVGGTNLQLAADGSIALESAWGDGKPGDEGGGGGVDPSVLMPSWQKGIAPGTHRCVPDSAANADPNSGWQISSNGSWGVVGGTSASAPFTAALVAVLAKGMAKRESGLLTPEAYAGRATAFSDIVSGSDGSKAVPGYDTATGNGSPNGEGLLNAFC